MTELTNKVAEATPAATTTTEAVTTAAPVETKLFAGKFKTTEDLEKSYLNLETMASKKVSELPEEIIKQYLKVPSAPEKYVLSEDADKIIDKSILEEALKANVSQDQLKALTDKMVELNRHTASIQEEAAKKEMEKRVTALKEKFGTSLEGRLKQIDNIFSKYGDENLLTKAKESGIMHDVGFIEFFDKITQEALSAKLIASDSSKKLLTPAEAKEQIQKKLQDAAFRDAYFSRQHPGHSAAVAEIKNLADIV